MKRGLILIVFLLLTVAVANIPKVSLAIMVVAGDNDYKKGNYHFSAGEAAAFSVWSRKGFDDTVIQFLEHKKRHPEDSVLYRNFEPDYKKFWRWQEYWLEERYALPFRKIPSDAYLVNRGNE